MKYLILKVQFLILVACFLLLTPFFTKAAILYLEPSSGEYHHGDTFIVNVRINTEDECINIVEANLTFSQNILKAIDFSQGNSIMTLWVKPPTIAQESGLISFAGGIPGGYCGILPGGPGASSLLGRIAFQVRETDAKPEHETDAKIDFLEGTRVLLNDGFGTLARLTTKGAIFTILAEKLEVPKDDWTKELEKDDIPPESFEIEIHQDPAIFEGKYFIIFSTTDKQTGIDHFEILETRDRRQGTWKIGESPYLLKDQSLTSIIRVKAVDKAGNERIAEYLPPKEPFPWWLIVVILAGAGAIWWITRKIIKATRDKRQEVRS